MPTNIWWIRRDLRLTDNQALSAALAEGGDVVPVVVLDPAILESERVGPTRVAFYLGGLRALNRALRERGARLVVRRGEPLSELMRLRDETGAADIYAEADVSPYALERDNTIAEALPLERVGHPTARQPGTILKDDGDPYVVYSPYMRKWKAAPPIDEPLPAPTAIPMPDGLVSEPIPDEPAQRASVPFPPGEGEAQRRLARFARGDDPAIRRYAQDRDRLDRPGTSQLSPYLRLGMLSARQAVRVAQQAMAAAPDKDGRKGAETWLNELIWREFYVDILYHYPNVLQQSFRENTRDIQWAQDEEGFQAWCQGRTGYPVVDAAMRQLLTSGWMHNRARMIVASFLVKDLLIDWRRGELFFMQRLIDGDHAANNGGWQWTAGTGTDAAPYFRIFNPISQGKKHDPEGQYVRRWVPELRDVPLSYLHAPWEMPADVQRQAGCVIGSDYPAPIVDHHRARDRVLAAYKAARGE